MGIAPVAAAALVGRVSTRRPLIALWTAIRICPVAVTKPTLRPSQTVIGFAGRGTAHLLRCRIGASTETQIEVSANTRIICSDALVCSGCHSRSWATACPCRRTTHARWTQRRAASRIRPARFAPLRRPGPTAPPGRFPGRGHRDPRPRNQQSTAAAAAHRAANLRILTPRKTTARPYLSRWPDIVSPGPDFPDRPAGGSVIFRGRRSVTHGG